jgi:hypothetical protein
MCESLQTLPRGTRRIGSISSEAPSISTTPIPSQVVLWNNGSSFVYIQSKGVAARSLIPQSGAFRSRRRSITVGYASAGEQIAKQAPHICLHPGEFLQWRLAVQSSIALVVAEFPILRPCVFSWDPVAKANLPKMNGPRRPRISGGLEWDRKTPAQEMGLRGAPFFRRRTSMHSRQHTARSETMPGSKPARCPRSGRTGVQCRSKAGSWSQEHLFFGGSQSARRSASCLRAGWRAIPYHPG